LVGLAQNDYAGLLKSFFRVAQLRQEGEDMPEYSPLALHKQAVKISLVVRP
jgi:hypothetical protein